MQRDSNYNINSKNISRREVFALQIRKKQRHTIFEHHRKQFLTNQPNLSELIKKISFGQQAIAVLRSLPQYQEFFDPRSSINSDVSQSRKEKEFFDRLALHNNYLSIFPFLKQNLFKVFEFLREQEIIQAHVQYWMQLGNLLVEKREFKKMGIQTIQKYNFGDAEQPSADCLTFFKDYHQVCQFFSIFFQHHSNRNFRTLPKLNRNILQVLQLLTQQFPPTLKFQTRPSVLQTSQTYNIQMQNFKLKVLEWLRSSQNPMLILNCIPNGQFLHIKHYKNIYKIIEQSIKSQSRETQIAAAEILVKISIHADYDDNDQLYRQCGGIMTNLLNEGLKLIEALHGDAQEKLNNESYSPGIMVLGLQTNPFSSVNPQQPTNLIDKSIQINDSKQMVCLKSLSHAIIMILDTYDSILIDYVRAGVALFGAQVVTSTCDERYLRKYHKSHCQSNIINGLDLFRLSSCPNDSQNINFLLKDQSIKDTGFWELFGQSTFLMAHPNSMIRKLFITITFNIIVNGGYQQVLNLCQKVQLDSLELSKSPSMRGTVPGSEGSVSSQNQRVMQNQVPSYLLNNAQKYDLMDVLHSILSRDEEIWEVIYYTLECLQALLCYGEEEPLDPLIQNHSFGSLEQIPYHNPIAYRMEMNGTIGVLESIAQNKGSGIKQRLWETAEKIIDGLRLMRNR